MRLGFHGATGTVTGSKYRVQTEKANLLVDCGLFQGYKQLRLRNWSPLPFDVRTLDAVVLTHAHLDHSGYLVLLVRNGFDGPVHCTEATYDLCRIMRKTRNVRTAAPTASTSRRCRCIRREALGRSCQVPDYRKQVELGEAR